MSKNIHVFFGFKNGKLHTIMLSKSEEQETAIDCDYYIPDPQDAEKQIEEWKKNVRGERVKITEYKPNEVSNYIKDETAKLFPEAVVKRINSFDDYFEYDNILVHLQQKGIFRTKKRRILNINLMSGQIDLYDSSLLERTKKIARIIEEKRSRSVEIFVHEEEAWKHGTA
jgi:hypothetical protein